MNNKYQKIAWLFSAAFAKILLIALIPNPIVGKEAIFKTNLMHDFVHLLTSAFKEWG